MSAPAPSPTPVRPLRAPVDLGWLFLLAGVAVLGATILIPAQDDLAEARWLRDRAEAVEAHRLERLARYQAYLDALERRDTALVRALAAEQLHLIPESHTALRVDTRRRESAAVFASIEPGPVRMPQRPRTGSLLERLTTDDGTRLWLLAAGMLAILLGLLPASARR